MQRHAKHTHAEWEKTCWHMGARRIACETDAQTAIKREKRGQAVWHALAAPARHGSPGQSRTQDGPLTREWHIVATLRITQQRVEHETLRKACCWHLPLLFLIEAGPGMLSILCEIRQQSFEMSILTTGPGADCYEKYRFATKKPDLLSRIGVAKRSERAGT
jgi:hypothetical protein